MDFCLLSRQDKQELASRAWNCFEAVDLAGEATVELAGLVMLRCGRRLFRPSQFNVNALRLSPPPTAKATLRQGLRWKTTGSPLF